jgi:multidrug efflux pump subunit AcrB
MYALSKFFVDNAKFTIVAMIGLIIFGFSGLISLNSETFPTVKIGTVIITTVYPGASASDIESRITKPLEDGIRSVRGLKQVKSVSQAGISRVVVVTDVDNYDVETVVADVQRAVDRTQNLPQDLPARPRFLEVKSDEFPVLELAVLGSNEDRLRDRIAFELKEELEDNANTSSVVLTGYRERQFNILVDRQKMERLHVGLNEIRNRVAFQNLNMPGGKLEDGASQTILKIDGKMRSVEELENLVIRANFSGEQVLLKDVARVQDSVEDAETLALYEGKPATFVTVAKKGGADVVKLSREIRATVDKLGEKYKGKVEFAVFNDEGKRVGSRVSVLSSNGLAGLFLVFVFLLVFLPGRAGLMAAVSLPLAVMATLGYMSATGMTLNTITIIALVISLGMLVDNAVVIAENFSRLNGQGHSPREAILTTIRDLWLPITATAMTTIAAFLPMLVTKGVMGQFISGIPMVVSAALLFSLAESFFMLPVRLVGVRGGAQQGKTASVGKPSPDWFDRYLAKRFMTLIDWLVRRRYVTLGLFSFLIIGSVLMIAVVNKFILFPADQTEMYVARLELPEQSRIELTEKKMQDLALKVRAELGDAVDHVTARIGVSESDFGDPKSRRGENVGLLMMFMTAQAKNTLPTNSVLARLRTIKVEDVKNLSFEARVGGPPVGAPVTAVFRSNNMEHLNAVTEKITQALTETKGVFDIEIDDVYGAEELALKVDQRQAARLGLDLATIGSAVRIAIAGEDVADVNLNNRTVDYFVRLDDRDRRSSADLRLVKVMDRMGNLIPLSQVASLVPQEKAPQVKRDDFKRAKTVTANINDEVITSFEANAIVERTFARLAQEYEDVSLKFGGEGERTKESVTSLFQALILAVIGIFALLVFLFNSFIRPLIILSTIPLGLVGVAVSFYLHGRPISFLSLIGVIGLSGIIVNSGIVLISFIEQMKTQGQLSLHEILVRSSGLRLRAVVVTSLTTVCGLFPTAYGIGGADEFIIPLAMAMAWGLASGTILTLLWVPCAYAITEDLAGATGRLFGRPRRSEVAGEVVSAPEVAS